MCTVRSLSVNPTGRKRELKISNSEASHNLRLVGVGVALRLHSLRISFSVQHILLAVTVATPTMRAAWWLASYGPLPWLQRAIFYLGVAFFAATPR